ncbi:amidohydrolase [Clostridium sp. CAG:149]|nr:amidohydrolase [Clostridium sp. CAG:149]
MNNAGLFDDCAAAISWHPTDDNGIWSINFHAQQKVEYTFEGGNGASALDGLNLFLMGAQNLRHHLEPCFVVRSSILETGDEREGELPKRAKILYSYRAHTGAQIREAMSLLHCVAKGAAVASGCRLTAEYKTGYSELLPNRSLERIMYSKYEKVGTVPMTEEDWRYAEKMHQAMPDGCEEPTFDLMRLLYEEQAEDIIERVKGKPYNDVLYPFREIEIHKPGSTDICDVSWTTPTAQCVVACYAKDTLGHSWQEVAQGRSGICMKGMLVAAKVMGLTGIELFSNPEALKAVREEFERKRPNYTYIPLNARTVTENGRE